MSRAKGFQPQTTPGDTPGDTPQGNDLGLTHFPEGHPLREMQGFSTSEISKRLGRDEKTIKSARSWLNETYYWCETGTDPCLKNEDGTLTLWGFQRLIDLLENTGLAQYVWVESKGKFKQVPQPQPMKRDEYQNQIWKAQQKGAFAPEQAEAVMAIPVEFEIPADLGTPQGNTPGNTPGPEQPAQVGGQIVLSAIDEGDQTLTLNLAEGSMILAQEGAQAINLKWDSVFGDEGLLGQVGQAVQAKVRDRVVASGLQGMDQGAEILAKIIQQQAQHSTPEVQQAPPKD